MKVGTIAFYNWRYPYGGGEVVTFNLARFFRSQGMRVLLYTRELISDKLTQQDQETFEFRPLTGSLRSGGGFVEVLCTSLREEKADCIIVQGVTEFPFAAVHETTDCKIVFCLHNKPLWEVDFLRKQRCTEIKNPTFARKVEFLVLRKPSYYLTPKLRRRMTGFYARMLRPVDKCVLLCEAYRQELETRIRRKSPKDDNPRKYAAILNPLVPAAPEPPSSKEKIVLYVGRLVRVHKRIDRLLKIWRMIESKHPDWRLQIIGDGEERGSLEQEAQRLGLRRAEFMGYQSDMAPFYRKAAFICLTSNFEGLPMSLMEGQQYGVIPVSFDSYAGIREIACDGECGIIVPAFNLRRYARMLGAAMDDEALQERMRQGCFAAARRYDPQVVGQAWLRLFESL